MPDSTNQNDDAGKIQVDTFKIIGRQIVQIEGLQIQISKLKEENEQLRRQLGGPPVHQQKLRTIDGKKQEDGKETS